MAPRRTIDAQGNLVVVGGDAPSSSSGAAPQQQSLLGSLQSLQTVNAFGFQLPARQFWIGLAVVALFLGLKGGTKLSCFSFYLLVVFVFFPLTILVTFYLSSTDARGGAWTLPFLRQPVFE